MEVINCPICNSNKSQIFIKQKFDLLNKEKEFNLVKCECDLIYLNPRPNELEISEYYNKESYQPHSVSKSFKNKIFSFFQFFTFSWKKNILNKYLIQTKRSILDFGSGKGDFSKFVNKYGFDSDPYDPFYKNGNELTNKKYDCITLWHSLEHIHDLPKLFNIIDNYLNESGYLFIAVPNINSYDFKIFKNNWVALDLPRHLYHFETKTISNLLLKNRYEIIDKYSMFQDTAFNIFNSMKSLNFLNLFCFVYMLVVSYVNILFKRDLASSILYICKRK